MSNLENFGKQQNAGRHENAADMTKVREAIQSGHVNGDLLRWTRQQEQEVARQNQHLVPHLEITHNNEVKQPAYNQQEQGWGAMQQIFRRPNTGGFGAWHNDGSAQNSTQQRHQNSGGFGTWHEGGMQAPDASKQDIPHAFRWDNHRRSYVH